MDKSDIEVGDVWVSKAFENESVNILFVGDEAVFLKDMDNAESSMYIKHFLKNYSPKPKEPECLGDLMMCLEDYEEDERGVKCTYRKYRLIVGDYRYCNKEKWVKVQIKDSKVCEVVE